MLAYLSYMVKYTSDFRFNCWSLKILLNFHALSIIALSRALFSYALIYTHHLNSYKESFLHLHYYRLLIQIRYFVI